MLGIRRQWLLALTTVTALTLVCGGAVVAAEEVYEPIGDDACTDCHDQGPAGENLVETVTHSVHEGFACSDCHPDKTTAPHRPDSSFSPGIDSCGVCHDEAAETYVAHGRVAVGSDPDIPSCSDCHGSHDILSAGARHSTIHPANLPRTCGRCHADLDLVTKHEILVSKPIQIYEASVHGQAAQGGVYLAATCNDCHSANGSAHRILSPGHPDSSINHFNIPETCGTCHKGVENDYWEGIHGQLARRGETDAPVCTHCHGEHGIISPSDPLSPVSSSRLAEATCSPCHDSAVLNEKYGLRGGRLRTFIDSYHGLKSKAGDTHVANCASCHGAHRILPSSNPESSIHASNLRTTCGECHPNISERLAASPIHGVTGRGLRTGAADVVENIYIVAIVVIIGLMVLHWLLDLYRHLKVSLERRPQLRRMLPNEVVQHAVLMISFAVLVVSGFALRYSEGWAAELFFGWESGFTVRGVIHRWAAVVFLLTVVWHAVFITTTIRGRRFLRDIMPAVGDFRQFAQRIAYNLGRRSDSPRFGRFSYVEKAEYWALVWGTAVMVATGTLLWFDNWFVSFLPKGVLDVSLVIHFWEAWLATLAILVWHIYSTVFSPHVYPMNPSWLTGTMPEEMYRAEHPEHVDEARRETEAFVRARIRSLRRTHRPDPPKKPSPVHPPDSPDHTT